MTMMHVLFATELSSREVPAFHAACRLAMQLDAHLTVLHVRGEHEHDWEIEQQMERFIPADISLNFDSKIRSGNPVKQILAEADQAHIGLIVLGTHGREGVKRAFSGSVAEKVLRNSKVPVLTVRAFDRPILESPRILVPVDFSEFGYVAYDYANKLASVMNAELTFAHVDTTTETNDATLTNEQIVERDKDQKNLWTQLTGFQARNPTVNVSHKLLTGKPAEEICKYANNKQFDYIVLGTHGRTGLRRALLGSVAEQIVRHANCAVITVKPTNERAHLLT